MHTLSPKDIEIMSPAGSFESLRAAIQAGCDSIYFGVTQLNMRAKAADNLTLSDIAKVSALCKKHGIKSYLAVNTLLYDHDIRIMRLLIDTAKQYEIDAIIAFDFATIQYCNEVGIPVHISVQFSVSNYESLKFFAQFSNRVVLARELTLDQISDIYQKICEENLLGREEKRMEIEAFVHGALCVAQSGRCYMSLYTNNASANRGACRQNCRAQYKVTDRETGKELVIDNQYIMSAADICMIDSVDKLLAAGVQTFKIEGRGRSPEYVYTVTKAYKEALNDLKNNTYTSEKIQQYLTSLQSVYNRKLSHGNYYLGKELGDYSNTHGSQATKEKLYVGTVRNYFAKIGIAEIAIETQAIHINDEIVIIGSETGVYKGNISELRNIHEKPIISASKNEIVTFPVTEKVRRKDNVYIWKEKTVR